MVPIFLFQVSLSSKIFERVSYSHGSVLPSSASISSMVGRVLFSRSGSFSRCRNSETPHRRRGVPERLHFLAIAKPNYTRSIFLINRVLAHQNPGSRDGTSDQLKAKASEVMNHANYLTFSSTTARRTALSSRTATPSRQKGTTPKLLPLSTSRFVVTSSFSLNRRHTLIGFAFFASGSFCSNLVTVCSVVQPCCLHSSSCLRP